MVDLGFWKGWGLGEGGRYREELKYLEFRGQAQKVFHICCIPVPTSGTGY